MYLRARNHVAYKRRILEIRRRNMRRVLKRSRRPKPLVPKEDCCAAGARVTEPPPRQRGTPGRAEPGEARTRRAPPGGEQAGGRFPGGRFPLAAPAARPARPPASAGPRPRGSLRAAAPQAQSAPLPSPFLTGSQGPPPGILPGKPGLSSCPPTAPPACPQGQPPR